MWPKWATKLIIGVAAVVAGAAIVAATAATGGAAAAFIGAAVTGLKAAAISGAIAAGTNAAITTVKSVKSGDDFKTAVKNISKSAFDGFADGFMTGGIVSGAGMGVGSLLKSAKGIQLGTTAKTQYGRVNIGYGTPKTSGNTLISIQNSAGKSVFRLDMDAVNAVHMHLPTIIKAHIPVGSIASGVFSGIRR